MGQIGSEEGGHWNSSPRSFSCLRPASFPHAPHKRRRPCGSAGASEDWVLLLTLPAFLLSPPVLRAEEEAMRLALAPQERALLILGLTNC